MYLLLKILQKYIKLLANTPNKLIKMNNLTSFNKKYLKITNNKIFKMIIQNKKKKQRIIIIILMILIINKKVNIEIIIMILSTMVIITTMIIKNQINSKKK